MKKLLLIAITCFVVVFMACNKHDLPTIITPVVGNVQISETIGIGFEITADAGYHSYDVYAEKGKAEYHTDIGQGAVQGLIFIKYTANSEVGTDYITFIVHDLDGKQALLKVSVEVVTLDK